MRSSQGIVTDINKFEPADGDWLELDTLLNELWLTGNQESFTTDLLKVFERFPDEDGAGVFWSIVHGIERFRSYEIELLDSLNVNPLKWLLYVKKIMERWGYEHCRHRNRKCGWRSTFTRKHNRTFEARINKDCRPIVFPLEV
jgi:hypothetical protein